MILKSLLSTFLMNALCRMDFACSSYCGMAKKNAFLSSEIFQHYTSTKCRGVSR